MINLSTEPDQAHRADLTRSHHSDDAIVHHGVLDTGTQFIGKPLTQFELLRKVREVLDG